VLLPGALVMGIMNPVTGKLFDMFGVRWLAIIGFFILTATTFMFTNLSTETSFLYLTVTNTIRMFSMSMVMIPVTTAGLNQLPMKIIPHGTVMSNTFRQMAGSVGIAVLVTIMATTAIPNTGMEGLIHGVNVTFIVASIVSLVGFLLTFKIKPL